MGLVDEYAEMDISTARANYACRPISKSDSIMANQWLAFGNQYQSLLFPAHFRRITKPFCKKENEKYHSCAQYSNLSTEVWTGDMKLQSGPCPELPKHCLDGTWLQ